MSTFYFKAVYSVFIKCLSSWWLPSWLALALSSSLLEILRAFNILFWEILLTEVNNSSKGKLPPEGEKKIPTEKNACLFPQTISPGTWVGIIHGVWIIGPADFNKDSNTFRIEATCYNDGGKEGKKWLPPDFVKPACLPPDLIYWCMRKKLL